MVSILVDDYTLEEIEEVVKDMTYEVWYNRADLETIQEELENTPLRMDGITTAPRFAMARYEHMQGAVEYHFSGMMQ